jgi:hypothetical protein
VRKKRVNKYPTAFRKMALERLKSCRNATELATELGIHRTQLVQVAGSDGTDRGGTRSARQL